MLMLVLVALAPPTVVAVVVALEERGEARTHAQADVLDATRLAAIDAASAVDATASFLSAVAEDLAARPGVKHCERLLGLVPESYGLLPVRRRGRTRWKGVLRDHRPRVGPADETGGRVPSRMVPAGSAPARVRPR